MAPDVSPATRDTRSLLCSLTLNPYVALRDKFWGVTIGLLLCSKLYPYTRTYVALHDKHMTQHLTYFPFLHCRTLTARPCCQFSVLMGLDGFPQKIKQEPLFFAPVLTNTISGIKLIASAKYQNRDHRKRRSAPQSPKNSACPFSSVVHHTPLG